MNKLQARLQKRQSIKSPLDSATEISGITENLAHHTDQLQDAFIADAVIDTVGFLARYHDPLFAQNGQVLRDIALRGANGFDNFLNAGFLIADDTQDFKAQGVGNRFERMGCQINMFLFVNEAGGSGHDERNFVKHKESL